MPQTTTIDKNASSEFLKSIMKKYKVGPFVGACIKIFDTLISCKHMAPHRRQIFKALEEVVMGLNELQVWDNLGKQLKNCIIMTAEDFGASEVKNVIDKLKQIKSKLEVESRLPFDVLNIFQDLDTFYKYDALCDAVTILLNHPHKSTSALTMVKNFFNVILEPFYTYANKERRRTLLNKITIALSGRNLCEIYVGL